MSTIASLILDNDVIGKDIDAGNIKKTLGRFTDKKILKEHVRNILLNNIISSMLKTFLTIGHNFEIEKVQMNDRIQSLLISMRDGCVVKKEDGVINEDEINNVSIIDYVDSKNQKLTVFQTLLILYSRWILLQVQFLGVKIFKNEYDLEKLKKNKATKYLYAYALSFPVRKSRDDKDDNDEDDNDENDIRKYEHGDFDCDILNKEVSFEEWFFQLHNSRNSVLYEGLAGYFFDHERNIVRTSQQELIKQTRHKNDYIPLFQFDDDNTSDSDDSEKKTKQKGKGTKRAAGDISTDGGDSSSEQAELNNSTVETTIEETPKKRNKSAKDAKKDESAVEKKDGIKDDSNMEEKDEKDDDSNMEEKDEKEDEKEDEKTGEKKKNKKKKKKKKSKDGEKDNDTNPKEGRIVRVHGGDPLLEVNWAEVTVRERIDKLNNVLFGAQNMKGLKELNIMCNLSACGLASKKVVNAVREFNVKLQSIVYPHVSTFELVKTKRDRIGSMIDYLLTVDHNSHEPNFEIDNTSDHSSNHGSLTEEELSKKKEEEQSNEDEETESDDDDYEE